MKCLETVLIYDLNDNIDDSCLSLCMYYYIIKYFLYKTIIVESLIKIKIGYLHTKNQIITNYNSKSRTLLDFIGAAMV